MMRLRIDSCEKCRIGWLHVTLEPYTIQSRNVYPVSANYPVEAEPEAAPDEIIEALNAAAPDEIMEALNAANFLSLQLLPNAHVEILSLTVSEATR